MNKHLTPRYYGYSGGFTKTCKCKKCGLVGLYEDLHPARVCFECGGSVAEYVPAKWIPELTEGFWMFKTVVKAGYWGDSNGTRV